MAFNPLSWGNFDLTSPEQSKLFLQQLGGFLNLILQPQSILNLIQNDLVPINVQTYGAHPTGVNDSTAAFNNALAANLAVYVPGGTYKIVGTINITQDNTHFFGDGPSTMLNATTPVTPIIK